jgi:hypothetical protein
MTPRINMCGAWTPGPVGTSTGMTLSQQDRKSLKDNWDEAKSQIAQRFPGMTPDSLGSEPDADKIAQTTGQDRTEVEATLRDVARQYNS